MEDNNKVIFEEESFFDPSPVVDSETKYYITPDNKPEEICFYKNNAREYCCLKFVEVEDEGRYETYEPSIKQGYKLYIKKKEYIKIASIITKALKKYSLYTNKLNIPIRETVIVDVLLNLSYKDIRALSRGDLNASDIYRRLNNKKLDIKMINN